MKALIAIGLAIVATGAAAFATAFPQTWEDMAEEKVVAFIHAATGENVHVGGKTSVTILPAPTVTLEDVEIGGTGRPEDQPLLSAPSLRISLRVLPLLSGRFEPGTVTLDNAEIRLDWDAEAEPRALLSRLVQYLQHPLVTEARNGAVDAVELRDGHVWLTDNRQEQNEELTAIDMKLALGANRTRVELDGSLQWRQRTIELSANLGNPRDLFTATGSRGALTIAATPVEQTADTLDALAPPKSGTQPPQGALQPVGPLSVRGIFKVTEDGTITLNGAAIGSPGALASGNVILDLQSNRPLLSGMLEFDAFDLGPHVAALLPSSYGNLWEIPFAPSWLRDIDIDLTARAPELYFGPLDFSQPTMRFHTTAGRTTITLLETGLAGGQIRGRLAILPTPSGASVRFTGDAEHISLGDIGRALWPAATSLPVGQRQPPEGTIYAAVALEGRGATLGVAINTLDGWAVTVARNGSLGGANIVSTLEQLAAGSVLPGSGEPFMPVAGRTEFSTFMASATVRDGIIHLPFARFEGDSFEINLSGQARLIDGMLEAEGTASLDAPAMPDADDDRPGIQLPFGVGGTVREPVFAPGIPRIGGRAVPHFATQVSQAIPIVMDGAAAQGPGPSVFQPNSIIEEEIE